MTSLAAAVQTVTSSELAESLRIYDDKRIESSEHCGSATRTVDSDATIERAGIAVSQPVPAIIADHTSIPDDSKVYLFAKRVTDIVGSFVGLVITLPLFAVFAVLIKLTDGGPVFYPHTRVGKWGREFRCLKFRTMVVGADDIKAEIAHLNSHDDLRTFKVPHDPRVTRIGRLLRRTSLDELPQLWNILQGHMSLVGPRPPLPVEVEQYDLDDMQRLMVTPGLTCIWQVSGRSRHPFAKQLEMDLQYIQNRSYLYDMKLILRTIPAVVSADGAY